MLGIMFKRLMNYEVLLEEAEFLVHRNVWKAASEPVIDVPEVDMQNSLRRK